MGILYYGKIKAKIVFRYENLYQVTVYKRCNAGMKSAGKVVCANAKNKKELPKRTMKKIERCLK